MANVTITDLPSLSTMTDADVIPVVNVGANVTQKITGANLKTYFTGTSSNNITSGNTSVSIPSASGNVEIDADNNLWTFDTTGNLTIPGTSGGMIKTVANASIGVVAINNGTDNPAQLMSWTVGDTNPSTIISTYANSATVMTDVNGTMKTWAFDNAGNLTLPGNLVLASSTSIVGDGASPAPSLSGFTSVSAAIISASGNVTGGNVNTAGLISATGNVTGGNIATAGSVSATGQILVGPSATGFFNTATLNDYVGLNKTTGDITIGSLSATGSIVIGRSTASQTLSIASGVTGTGNTKSVNIGTNGAANSITNINIGTNTANATGNITFQSSMGVIIANTTATSLRVAGGISAAGGVITAALNLATAGTVLYNSDTADLIGTSKATTGITIGSSTGNGTIIVGQSTNTQTLNIAQGATSSGNTKTVNIGTGALAGSTTTIAVGPTTGPGTATFNTATTVTIANTSGTALNVAGGVSVAGNIIGNTNGFAIGYLAIPQVTFSANATAALTDSGKHYYSTTAGDLALTIPTNANVAFPTGTALTIVVQAAGNVVVTPQSGVTLYLAGNSTPGSRTVGSYGLATVMKLATDTWIINGTGVA